MCVAPHSSHKRKSIIADPIPFPRFVGCLGDRPHTFAAENHIWIGPTAVRADLEAIMFTTKSYQDLRPRSHAGASESERVGHVR